MKISRQNCRFQRSEIFSSKKGGKVKVGIILLACCWEASGAASFAIGTRRRLRPFDTTFQTRTPEGKECLLIRSKNAAMTQRPNHPTDPMILSIVIVNWNTRDYLLGALRSLYAAPPPFPFEVIVVDNASGDGSAEAVAREFPQARLIANGENAGYARGNNQGIEASTGNSVLLLNPDVTLPPGGLEKAVARLEQRPDVGALGVRLVNPDGTPQRSVRGFPTPAGVMWEALGLSRLFPRSRIFGAYRMTWFTYDEEAEVDQPMGTFLLISRRALDDVGLLDERFPIFFNEVDWLYRARQRGWKILFTPCVEVIHYGGGSTRQAGARMAWESRRGLLDFYRKHYRSPLFAPIYWLAAATSWLQAWRTARKRER
jgi:GT2 family glycosyltransferase